MDKMLHNIQQSLDMIADSSPLELARAIKGQIFNIGIIREKLKQADTEELNRLLVNVKAPLEAFIKYAPKMIAHADKPDDKAYLNGMVEVARQIVERFGKDDK
jgi:hypothetical protein